MEDPKELEDYFMELNKGKGNSLSFIDFITKIQKESYNQAIQDATENAKVIKKCEFNKVHQENYFEYIVDKDSILKLKNSE